MQLILDSNEYIFALGSIRDPLCEKLLEKVVELSLKEEIFVRITRLIIGEVRSNLTPEAFREFIILINTLTIIDEDVDVPFELGIKYEAMGLKPADALIAAYAEYVGADILVSENRHFLSRHRNLPFKVLTAIDSLKLIK